MQSLLISNRQKKKVALTSPPVLFVPEAFIAGRGEMQTVLSTGGSGVSFPAIRTGTIPWLNFNQGKLVRAPKELRLSDQEMSRGKKVIKDPSKVKLSKGPSAGPDVRTLRYFGTNDYSTGVSVKILKNSVGLATDDGPSPAELLSQARSFAGLTTADFLSEIDTFLGNSSDFLNSMKHYFPSLGDVLKAASTCLTSNPYAVLGRLKEPLYGGSGTNGLVTMFENPYPADSALAHFIKHCQIKQDVYTTFMSLEFQVLCAPRSTAFPGFRADSVIPVYESKGGEPFYPSNITPNITVYDTESVWSMKRTLMKEYAGLQGITAALSSTGLRSLAMQTLGVSNYVTVSEWVSFSDIKKVKDVGMSLGKTFSSSNDNVKKTMGAIDQLNTALSIIKTISDSRESVWFLEIVTLYQSMRVAVTKGNIKEYRALSNAHLLMGLAFLDVFTTEFDVNSSPKSIGLLRAYMLQDVPGIAAYAHQMVFCWAMCYAISLNVNHLSS